MGNTALIISFTQLQSEPRVLRQIHSLRNSDWRVYVFGFQPLIDSADDQLIQIPIDSIGLTPGTDALGSTLVDGSGTLGEDFLARIKPFFWKVRNRLSYMVTAPRGILPTLFRIIPIRIFRMRLADLWFRRLGIDYTDRASVLLDAIHKGDHSIDIVLCHDYFTVPLGTRLARAFDAPISVDCHEHAATQYAHKPGWVTFMSPLVKMKEGELLKEVASVTTVSDGIRDVLNSTYALKRPARTIRSVPFFEKVTLREQDNSVRILYSGAICQGRNLEGLVLALALTPDRFDLTFRGSESENGFKERLRAIASEAGVSDRFAILDPAPFHEIIADSANYDIGLFVPIDTGIQRRFTLPNKLFEYIMSGLAICVTDLPEMRRVVETFECGELVKDGRPESIAATLLSISGENLVTYKARSLEGANRLNWEKEESIFLSVVAGTLRSRLQEAARKLEGTAIDFRLTYTHATGAFDSCEVTKGSLAQGRNSQRK